MAPIAKDRDFLWLDRTESTNGYVRSHIDSLDNLSVVSAVEQISGRGQGSHSWHSAPGLNLTFSLLFKPLDLSAADGACISSATALGIRDYLGSKGIAARIKLPNDVWVGKRKISGILIENLLEGKSVRASIIGVGLNVNQTGWPEDIPNPVSMKELTGLTYDTALELGHVRQSLVARLKQIYDAPMRDKLREEFEKVSFSVTG